MERWNGKVAVVTGASAGIGYAVVKELAERGMVVVGLARRDQNIKDLAKTAKGTIHAVKCDIGKEQDIINAFDWVETNLGGVDLLVNNAGVLPLSPISDGDAEKWRQTLDINILGTSICTREALKTMRKRGDDGQIIQMNSMMGHKVYPMPSTGMYTASKHAITALTQVLRNELAEKKSKIKVTSLSPGSVHTDMAIATLKGAYGRDTVPVGGERPDGQLASQDLADAVVSIISMKPYVQVEEFILHAIK